MRNTALISTAMILALIQPQPALASSTAAVVEHTPDPAVISAVFDAADPAAAYAQLDAQQRADFDALELPHSVEIEETADPTPVPDMDPDGPDDDAGVLLPGGPPYGGPVTNVPGCYQHQVKGVVRNATKNRLYAYWFDMYWCYNKTRITRSVIKTPGGNVFWPGWQYLGVVGKARAAYPNVAVGWTQHAFQLKVGGTVVHSPRPCLRGQTHRNTGAPHRDYVCSTSV